MLLSDDEEETILKKVINNEDHKATNPSSKRNESIGETSLSFLTQQNNTSLKKVFTSRRSNLSQIPAINIEQMDKVVRSSLSNANIASINRS